MSSFLHRPTVRLGPARMLSCPIAAPCHVAPRRLPMLHGTRLRAGHVRTAIFRALQRVRNGPTGLSNGECGRVAGTENASPIIAARYASALFDIADERHTLDRIPGDLEKVKSLLADKPEL